MQSSFLVSRPRPYVYMKLTVCTVTDNLFRVIMVPPDRNRSKGFRSAGTIITGDFGPFLNDLVRIMKTARTRAMPEF